MYTEEEFKKLKAFDLRQILKNKYNYTEEEVCKIKGKSGLVAEILEVSGNKSIIEEQKDMDEENVEDVDFGDDNSSGDFETEVDTTDYSKIGLEGLNVSKYFDREEVNELGRDKPVKIGPSDPQWTEYVLSLLEDDKKEKIDGNPTTNGLRRIAPTLLGNIVESTSKVIQPPNEQNGYCVVIEHTMVYQTERDMVRISAVADATPENLPEHPYDKYKTAIADTRAEGRCLRRALKINVVTADELQKTSVAPEQYGEQKPGFITSVQTSFMSHMGKTHDIDIKKFIEQQDITTKVGEITHTQALELQEKLTAYGTNSDNIPEEILGYDSGWLTS